ncbi:hypothetical protein, partial [Pseudonocardia sp.]|uniref:hypothetical protein n=1 Tax=Pseudonocardia sp. TaxID=60912 RepID=UPI0031FBC655
ERPMARPVELADRHPRPSTLLSQLLQQPPRERGIEGHKRSRSGKVGEAPKPAQPLAAAGPPAHVARMISRPVVVRSKASIRPMNFFRPIVHFLPFLLTHGCPPTMPLRQVVIP